MTLLRIKQVIVERGATGNRYTYYTVEYFVLPGMWFTIEPKGTARGLFHTRAAAQAYIDRLKGARYGVTVQLHLKRVRI